MKARRDSANLDTLDDTALQFDLIATESGHVFVYIGCRGTAEAKIALILQK